MSIITWKNLHFPIFSIEMKSLCKGIIIDRARGWLHNFIDADSGLQQPSLTALSMFYLSMALTAQPGGWGPSALHAFAFGHTAP